MILALLADPVGIVRSAPLGTAWGKGSGSRPYAEARFFLNMASRIKEKAVSRSR